MKREIRVSEILLLMGYSFILLFMLSHDWIPLGSFNDIEAIREVKTVKELVTVTFINAGQIILLMGIIIAFIGKKYPIWIKLWLIIHPSCIFAGALIAWWIPYFFGYGAEARAENVLANVWQYPHLPSSIERNCAEYNSFSFSFDAFALHYINNLYFSYLKEKGRIN